MTTIRLTEPGAEFIQTEIVDRYFDPIEAEDRPDFFKTAEAVAEHLRKTGNKQLLVLPYLDEMLLEVLNAIDDAIDGGRTMQEFSMDARDARAMFRSGMAVRSKVLRELYAKYGPRLGRRD